MNSKKIIIATVIVFLVIVMTFAACKKGTEPIVVTDPYGNPVTDEHGDVITVVPETEIIEVTDANGEVVTNADGEVETTIRYIPQDVPIPVTDANGEVVTNANGEIETTIIVVPVESTTGIVINVPVTDEKGETQTNANGDVVTQTTVSSLPENTPSNNIAISNSIGGTNSDIVTGSAATPDGGFVLSIKTLSRDGMMTVTDGYNLTASVVVKYGKTGRQEWIKAIGGQGSVIINDICVDSDGNIFVAGEGKKNGFFTIHGNEYDAFIQKYSPNGDLVFTKNWGGKYNESFNGIAIAPDGSIITSGFAYSRDGDCEVLNIPKSESVAVVVKFDKDGNVVDQKGFGAFGDYFSDVAVNSNGEIFLSGIFTSKTENSYITSRGASDVVLFKLGNDLSTIFSKQWGGAKVDYVADIVPTSDGGCIAAGNSKSSDNSLSPVGNKGENDAVVMKFGSDGQISWIKSFAGTGNDVFTSVALAKDGSIAVAGYSNSNNRDFKFVGNLGGTDGFVAKYTASGTLVSAQCFGGSSDDVFTTISILSNGQTLVAGSTLSSDGYMAGMNPKSDGTKEMGIMFSYR